MSSMCAKKWLWENNVALVSGMNLFPWKEGGLQFRLPSRQERKQQSQWREEEARCSRHFCE